ncbi:MAG: replication-associated recombination protein A [Deltaproteobacteria bacterium]|nr:replication-associated recombination protein A [Deltaproteobacteria bacterium]
MHSPGQKNIPLAERMRPDSLDGFAGQEHLVGPERLLRRLISSRQLPSLLLWGPPGSGKTTLATILARAMDADFIFFSAVLAGVKDIRRIVETAKEKRAKSGNTILFVDEIHRFNKGQQDAFLPHVESGLLTLIGATTENPSFNVIAPLLSRCQVLVLNPLTADDIRFIVARALADAEHGLGALHLTLDQDGLDALVRFADGDSRRALNCLETAATLVQETDKEEEKSTVITADIIREAGQYRSLRYDTGGEEHYNLISALHKSLRDSDPDGAAYWLYRMLDSGEDPLYIARRLIRFASEDIGNADPQALQVAMNCREAFHLLGSPEGELALLQAAAYLATAPKSNALYAASKKIRTDIKQTGTLPVPMHLRNAPTRLMKNLGYGRDYQYAHDNREGLVDQEHLPSELKGRIYYEPTNRGYEAVIRDRLIKWRKILKQRAIDHAQHKNRPA